MKSQDKGVRGPLEIAAGEGVQQAETGLAGEGEALCEGLQGLGVKGAGVLEDVGGVAVEKAEIDGIHWVTSIQHFMMYLWYIIKCCLSRRNPWKH